MKRALPFCLILLLASVPVCADSLKLFVALDDVSDMHEPLVRNTQTALAAALPDYQIEVCLKPKAALLGAVEHREAAFFIASGAIYRQALPFGARDLATMVSNRAEDPNQSDGALVLVRGEELAMQRIQDLKGARVAFNPDEAGAQADMLRAEFVEKVPEGKIGGLIPLRAELPALLETLKQGVADAVVLPACLIEWYAETHVVETARLRVLNPQQHTSLHCFHSTKLYPNLTLATTPAAPPAISRAVTLALLAMPPTSDGFSWQVATDFSETDRMLRVLEKDFNAPLRRWSLPRIWNEYKPWFYFAFAGLGALVANSLLLGRLVRQRTEALSEALDKQKEAERQAKTVAQRLSKIQKVGVIGQMSTLFAHEIRQPLSAIGLWAYSLKKMLLKHQGSAEMLEAADGILMETKRSDAIVQKIRDYARSREVRRDARRFSEITEEAVRSFHSTSLGYVPVETAVTDDGFVFIDPFEIELAIVNLLRNAAEAQVGMTDPAISLILSKDVGRGGLQLIVTDRGPKLEAGRLAEIESVLESTKPDGFGLGLAIVRSIAEAHGGRLELFRSAAGGLGASLSLPEVSENASD